MDFAKLRPGVRAWTAPTATVDDALRREMTAAAEDVALDRAIEDAAADRVKASFRAGLLSTEDGWSIAAPVASVIESAPPPPDETFAVPPELHADTSFLYGGAGCGKTYLSRQIVAHEKGTLLCASTGIAAVNLGEGTTINSALGYFDTPSLVEKYTSGFLTATMGKLWKAGVRRIILDEVSMLDAVQLTCITRALDELSGRAFTANVMLAEEVAQAQAEEGVEADAEGYRPWPIKLLLVGDFLQLPPVKAEYAFASPEWPRYDAHKLELTTIRRQADAAFIEALRAARRGDAGPVCDYFGPRLSMGVATNFAGVTIVGRNEEVDRMNALRMDTLPGTAVLFRKTGWGEPRTDWGKIPETLALKVGALVMVLANAKDSSGGAPSHEAKLLYANGDLGTVEALDHGLARVRLQRTGTVETILPITRNHERPLEPGRKAELKRLGQLDKVSQDGRFEIVGQVTYVPLRVAYASTVHKSQGLTLDHVQVNTRDGFFKTPGLLYVALSRARTVEGLRIVGSVDGLRARVQVDARVRQWV